MQELPEEQRQLGERLRRHLKFFFMDPMQKYKVRKQFPFKLALQILKVAFVTIQVRTPRKWTTLSGKLHVSIR